MTKDEALLMTLATLEEGNFVYPTALRTAIEEALAQPEQEPVGLDKDTLRDMAGAAFETAMAFGISTDSFERLARDVNKRIVAALAQPEQGQGIKGYAMALNEVSLKLRKRYEQDLIATPLWAEFEKARNRLARSVAQPEQEPVLNTEAKLKELNHD